MKTKFKIIQGAGAIVMAAYLTHAQSTSSTNVEETTYARQRWLELRQQMHDTPLRAGEFVGMKVENFQDQKLGKVTDLAVNLEAGRIIQVIVSSGGFAGIDASLIPVPPAALSFDIANNVLKMDVTPARFQGAPKGDLSKWAELNESNQVAAVYSYFQEPALASLTTGEAVPPHNQRAMDKLHNDEVAQQSREDLSAWFKPDAILPESKIIGWTVENSQSQPVGRVENLILDLPNSRVLAVVVSPGNVFALGAERKAYPPAAFHINDANSNLILNVSQEIISADGRAISPADADEQARSLRENYDRGSGSLTPLDQKTNNQ